MPDLGIDVLLKGSNMLRLLQGLGVAVQISLVSIAISMPLGIVVGSLMTVKTKTTLQKMQCYNKFDVSTRSDQLCKQS